MSVRDKAVNFRASEETVAQIEDIKSLFHPLMPDRSATLRWIVKTMWGLLFTDSTLADTFQSWQVLRRTTSAHGVTQMRFHFPNDNPFFPRIGRTQ